MYIYFSDYSLLKILSENIITSVKQTGTALAKYSILLTNNLVALNYFLIRNENIILQFQKVHLVRL